MLNDPFIYISLAALAGLILGLLIGKTGNDSMQKKEQEKTNEKEKEIAGEIYESLYDLHRGLVQTVKSYDSAVKTVLDKLPTPTEKIEELAAAQETITIEVKKQDELSAAVEQEEAQGKEEEVNTVEENAATPEPEQELNQEVDNEILEPKSENGSEKSQQRANFSI